MVKLIPSLVLFLWVPMAYGQGVENVARYQSNYHSINKNLMIGLGSYAVTNFVVSGIGYVTVNDPTQRRFHEMNIMWNTVNLGLAIPGYLKATRTHDPLSLNEMMHAQKRTERLFLINGILDIGYVAAGVWMRNKAPTRPEQQDIFEGYGRSLMLQGSFLLAFDVLAYIIHHHHSNQLPMLQNVSLGASSAGVGVRIALN